MNLLTQIRLFLLLTIVFLTPNLVAKNIVVSSKPFTESRLLGEMLAQIIEDSTNHQVDRKIGLGQMAMLIEGMKAGEVDFYVDYTGTLAHALLKKPELKSIDSIKKEINLLGLDISNHLGFNNTYAIAMLEDNAAKLNIHSLQDLSKHPGLIAGFNTDFIKRNDGFPNLQKVYDLNFNEVKGVTHGLKVQALMSKKIDLAELYATDSKLAKYPLRVLKDEKNAFAEYYAVIVGRQDTIERYPDVWKNLQKIVGKISRKMMTNLNAQVEIDKKNEKEVVQQFLNTKAIASASYPDWFFRMLEHILLVFIPLLFSICIGIPLAIGAFYYKKIGKFILGGAAIVQTIPSIALLCFLIPLAGIGSPPAYIALILYGLLPIMQGTFVGLQSIDIKTLESAKTLGLSPTQNLIHIMLPIASRSIISGIKTSAIINVGTATLAAFIGAGGFGEFIVAGLNLYDIPLILSGAIPAAIFAVILHFGFDWLESLVVSRGLTRR